MDSSGGQEKSLPGMGMPRWMKKTTERYNYADICASPPSNEDGFLHISRHRTQPPASNVNSDAQGNVECLQNQKKKSAIFRVESSPEMIPSSGEIEFPKEPQHFGRGTSILAKPDCTALKETSNFYKNIVTTTSSSTLVNLAMASQEGLTAPPRVTSATEVSVIGKAKPSISSEFDNSKASTNATLNSGLISADPSKTVMITTKPKPSQTEMNPPTKIQQLLTKANGIFSFQPDDTTPSSTPNATPTSSPQVVRRTGNPFFSGTQEKPNSGNWLFRSSSPVPTTTNSEKDLRNPYDLKGEMARPSSTGPNAPSSQKVRYVPRPSELRELNFWSPTSM